MRRYVYQATPSLNTGTGAAQSMGAGQGMGMGAGQGSSQGGMGPVQGSSQGGMLPPGVTQGTVSRSGVSPTGSGGGKFNMGCDPGLQGNR